MNQKKKKKNNNKKKRNPQKKTKKKQGYRQMICNARHNWARQKKGREGERVVHKKKMRQS